MLFDALLAQASKMPADTPFRHDRILIKLRNAGAGVHLQSMPLGYRVLRSLDDIGWQVIELPPGVKVLDAIERYQASGSVSVAEPDYWAVGTAAPNDPHFTNGNQWGLNNTGQDGGQADADIDAPEAWEMVHGAPKIIVAVIDTGIRYTHEDLAANLWTNPNEIPNNKIDDDGNGVVDDVHGFNGIARSGDPKDDNGHGTHVAGILGAAGDNGKGIAGVAWNVQIMACKFLDANNRGAISDAIECIHYARKNGAKVINASWAVGNRSSALQMAITAARDAGIIFVAAAGNETQNLDLLPRYPVCYSLDNIVGVASLTRIGLLDAAYSNYGKLSVDLAAPGAAIFSTWNGSDDSYRYMSGTSMATPFVTGAVALLRTRYPEESHRQIIDRLLAATDPISGLAEKSVSGGCLNLRKALGAPEIVSTRSPSAASVRLLLKPDGRGFQLRLQGAPGETCVVQMSTNFLHWTAISTNLFPTGGTLLISDPTADISGSRYYRAVSLSEGSTKAE